jgi:ankyrin repeat protein
MTTPVNLRRLRSVVMLGLLLLPLLTCAQIDPRLLAAIRQNNPQAVTAPLRAGANPNATDSLGATPLMWACY